MSEKKCWFTDLWLLRAIQSQASTKAFAVTGSPLLNTLPLRIVIV